MTTRRKRRTRARGAIESRPGGALRVKVYAGIDPLSGRRHYLMETIPATDPDQDAAAERALERLARQVEERRHPRTRASIRELMERHLDQLQVERTTLRRYADLNRLHVLPLLGHVPVAEIDGEILDSFLAELRRCREHCRRRGSSRTGKSGAAHVCKPLAAATVRRVYWLLSGAFERARRWRWITENPATYAKPPSAASPNPRPPSNAEAARILTEAWKDPDFGLLVWVTMVTGMRRGELCAVRLTDLDLDAGLIRLDHALAVDGREVFEKDTKTHATRRLVLDEYTVSLLRAYLRSRAETADLVGVRIHPNGWLFSGQPDHSTPLKPHLLTQRYARLAKRLGIATSLHKLRHYSATELIAAGVDVRTVAGRLGHAGGGTMTLKTYAAFVSEADQRAARELLGRLAHPPVEVDATGQLQVQIPDEPDDHAAPYQRIAHDLRAAIRCGALGPGDHLPTVGELATRYGVAPSTAKRAFDILSAQQLISVQRGRRATVRDDPECANFAHTP